MAVDIPYLLNSSIPNLQSILKFPVKPPLNHRNNRSQQPHLDLLPLPSKKLESSIKIIPISSPISLLIIKVHFLLLLIGVHLDPQHLFLLPLFAFPPTKTVPCELGFVVVVVLRIVIVAAPHLIFEPGLQFGVLSLLFPLSMVEKNDFLLSRLRIHDVVHFILPAHVLEVDILLLAGLGPPLLLL